MGPVSTPIFHVGREPLQSPEDGVEDRGDGVSTQGVGPTNTRDSGTYSELHHGELSVPRPTW